VMLGYYPLISGLGPADVEAVVVGVRDGTLHPMDAKKRLARRVVARFHGEAAARAAEEAFVRQFQAREVPAEVREVTVPVAGPGQPLRVYEIVLATHLAPSASEARRLSQQGGVRIEGERADDPYRVLELRPGDTLLVQRGRRDFVRLRAVAAGDPGGAPAGPDRG